MLNTHLGFCWTASWGYAQTVGGEHGEHDQYKDCKMV